MIISGYVSKLLISVDSDKSKCFIVNYSLFEPQELAFLCLSRVILIGTLSKIVNFQFLMI